MDSALEGEEDKSAAETDDETTPITSGRFAKRQKIIGGCLTVRVSS